MDTLYTITHELFGDCAPATESEIQQIVNGWNDADWTYYTHGFNHVLEVRAVRNQGSETSGTPMRSVHWRETSSEDEFYIVVGEIAPSLTLQKAAAMTPYAPVTLRKAILRGDLKGEKVAPRLWMVTREDLRAWVDNPAMHKTGVKAKNPTA